MTFAAPIWLNALFLLIPLGGLLWWGLQRRRARLRRFADAHLLGEVAGSYHRRADYAKSALLLAVFALAVTALARPQWGFEWREVRHEGLDILVAIDTSRSMLTQDVRPNRLERTRLALRDLVKTLAGDRVGLIAFAGEAFLVCPLTVDYEGFLLTLDEIDTRVIPRGGTQIGEAIREAVRAYKDAPGQYKVLILLTDGENLEGDPLSAASAAKEAGIRIYTIGIGTREGELIQVPDGRGGTTFLKDGQGNAVKSRLNESLLQEMALKTGGVYVRASGAEFGLDLIYDRELSKLEKREIESQMEKHYFERFQIPLALAAALLLLETLISRRRMTR